jgi:hypothetical protein
MDGTTTLGADDRLRTVPTSATAVRTRAGLRTAWSRLDDTYAGDATHIVERPARPAARGPARQASATCRTARPADTTAR